MLGREVRLPHAADTLVALGPGALRLVAYMDALDRVVGIEDLERRMVRSAWLRPYAVRLDESFLALPVVGPGGPGKLPDFERLLLADPALVVIVGFSREDADRIAARTQRPILALRYGTLGNGDDDLTVALRLLGRALRRPERAAWIETCLRDWRRDLQARTGKLPERERRTAYFGGISYKGSHGIESTQAGYTPAMMAHVVNVADQPDRSGHRIVHREYILQWNPDLLFLDCAGRRHLEADFARQAGFYALLTSVRNGRVYSLLPYNSYNTNVELALLNAYAIGKIAYPEAFTDVDLDAVARDLFIKLLSLPVGASPPAYDALEVHPGDRLRWPGPPGSGF